MKLKTIKVKIKELYLHFNTLNNTIPLNYCIEQNAGDSFNKDFIFDYFGVSVKKHTLGSSEHYLFCGSVLSRSNKNSIILGAGLISETISFKPYKRLVGCRGRLTLQRLQSAGDYEKPCFLGDPGMLVKEIFNNREELQNEFKKGKIGLIPHFVDRKLCDEMLSNDTRFKLIDIKRDYKSVCKDILSCDSILSSSLHGLIFSDALAVKNNWIKFSDNIVGGDFKFRDYYSVLDNPKDIPIKCRNIDDLLKANATAFISSNPNYQQMLHAIRTELGGYK